MVARALSVELERLYLERFQVFLRTVTAQLGDADVARDVVQEAFASALRGLGGFTGDGPLEAWVWRIVVNKALDERRSRAREEQIHILRVEAADLNGNAEERRLVRARLAALPERQRLAVFLHYYADLDYATIARVLEIAPGTVAASLNAARASLRDRLKEEIQ